jgi:hypothetical protein
LADALGDNRVATISGTPEACSRAHKMVMDIVSEVRWCNINILCATVIVVDCLASIDSCFARSLIKAEEEEEGGAMEM